MYEIQVKDIFTYLENVDHFKFCNIREEERYVITGLYKFFEILKHELNLHYYFSPFKMNILKKNAFCISYLCIKKWSFLKLLHGFFFFFFNLSFHKVTN